MYQFPTNPEDGDLINHPNGKDYAWNNTRGVWSVVRADLTTLSARVAELENLSFLILE
jgi:hypothetical protein